LKTFLTFSRAVLTGSLWACCAMAQTQALAQQDYPLRSITLVVPYPAGGSTDTLGRVLAEQLGRALKQVVVVENRPGAATNVGAEQVARAKPDGYTLLLASNATLAINPELYGERLRFNPTRDFAPIARLARTQLALVVPAASPVKTLAELTAQAKAEPGSLSGASFGIGSTSHMALELYKSIANIFIVHVPYRGSTPAMQDLIGAQVDLLFDTVVVAAPMTKAGRVRALAVTGAQRSTVMPDIPTMAQAGLKGYVQTVWFALVAPAKTPKDILSKLQQTTLSILAEDEVKTKLAALGFEPGAGKGVDVLTNMAAEAPVYRRIIEAAKITPE